MDTADMTLPPAMTSAEQQARDMLERMGIEDAQEFTAGDLVELANLIAAQSANRDAQADAARYQWLKKHRQSESYAGDIGIDFTCDFDNFNNIDASIDAAMKVKP